MCTVVDRSLDFTQSKDPSSDFMSSMLANSYRALQGVTLRSTRQDDTAPEERRAQHREKDCNKADTTATKTSPINAE